MDDVFKISRNGGDSYSLGFVNTFHEDIKFTLEKFNDLGCSVFLDMEIQRHVDGCLSVVL